MTGIEITIQVLTCSALVGLLGAVGLRLTYGEVKAALARCRFTAILRSRRRDREGIRSRG